MTNLWKNSSKAVPKLLIAKKWPVPCEGLGLLHSELWSSVAPHKFTLNH